MVNKRARGICRATNSLYFFCPKYPDKQLKQVLNAIQLNTLGSEYQRIIQKRMSVCADALNSNIESYIAERTGNLPRIP